MAKNKKVIPLKVPDPLLEVKQWLILGLDPSMSRTGYALMRVRKEDREDTKEGTRATWIGVGSVKPEISSNPIWLRGKMMAFHLRGLVEKTIEQLVIQDANNSKDSLGWTEEDSAIGLIISMEFPTPMNDFLVALNRIIHLVFFETNLWERFATVRVLTTNAATLRSLMGLTKTGAKNKGENIRRAYEFIDKTVYPKLDTDACDAVLLSMVARHTCSILMGFPGEVPEKYLVSLCNANQEMKGNGHNARIITKGLLHRKEYFYEYKRNTYTLVVNDASRRTNKLERIRYSI
jgi:hypothetical protein